MDTAAAKTRGKVISFLRGNNSPISAPVRQIDNDIGAIHNSIHNIFAQLRIVGNDTYSQVNIGQMGAFLRELDDLMVEMSLDSANLIISSGDTSSYLDHLRSMGLVAKLENLTKRLLVEAERRAFQLCKQTPLGPIMQLNEAIQALALRLKTPKKRLGEKAIMCPCGGRFCPMNGGDSEVSCQMCGLIKDNNSAMIYAGTKPGYTRFNSEAEHGKHRRHCLVWIDRIQGIDTPKIDLETRQRLEQSINQYGIPRAALTAEFIREKFKELNLTTLNPSTPYFVKMLGGPAPPTLTSEECEIILNRFLRILELFGRACPENANAPYYPYFIYRIIERHFAGNPEKLRLLKFIHLQSHDTIVKNDEYFAQICAIADKADDLVYTPTIAWD